MSVVVFAFAFALRGLQNGWMERLVWEKVLFLASIVIFFFLSLTCLAQVLDLWLGWVSESEGFCLYTI